MTECIRSGMFEEESHPCFVIGCNGFCNPKSDDTCSVCNFKKCNNDHCGCNLTPDALYAVKKLYETFCSYCEEYSHDFIRMPAVGRKGLTVLEAKLDSVQIRLHHALKIVRNALTEDRHATPDYMKIKRCTFRETKRTRCNRSPAKPIELPNGTVTFRCKRHQLSEWLENSVQPEIKTS